MHLSREEFVGATYDELLEQNDRMRRVLDVRADYIHRLECENAELKRRHDHMQKLLRELRLWLMLVEGKGVTDAARMRKRVEGALEGSETCE